MTTSSSTDFTYTVANVITDALKLMGIGNNGETATAQETNDTLRALEIILKEWSATGLKLSNRYTSTIPLTDAGRVYDLYEGSAVLSTLPLEIIQAYRRDSNGIDTPLTPISQEEYNRLSDKTATGVPNTFNYSRTPTVGSLIIYPVPDATIAAEYTIRITYRRVIEDADSVGNDLALPQQHYRALKWELAKEIMMEYDIPETKQNRISAEARRHRESMEGNDIERNTSVFFRPMVRRRS